MTTIVLPHLSTWVKIQVKQNLFYLLWSLHWPTEFGTLPWMPMQPGLTKQSEGLQLLTFGIHQPTDSSRKCQDIGIPDQPTEPLWFAKDEFTRVKNNCNSTCTASLFLTSMESFLLLSFSFLARRFFFLWRGLDSRIISSSSKVGSQFNLPCYEGVKRGYSRPEPAGKMALKNVSDPQRTFPLT